MLRKSAKKNYSNPNTYKFIALLNILNKILKSIILKHLRVITEKCENLLNIQMKIKKHQSINITLQLITKKIHII